MKRGSQNPLASFLKDMMFSGLEIFGKYYSSYRAFVADVEDPLNLNRVKLIIPQVTGGNIYDYWAYPKGVFAGKNYGIQCLPMKGDVVWVEFEGGHPEVPIWMHGYFAKKDIPKDKELNDYNSRWFKSPAGHVVIINDTKKTIKVKHANGTNWVEINDKAVSVIANKSVSLGSLDKSAEPALLGDKTVDLFEDIETIINKLHAAMLKDVSMFTSLGFVNTAKELPLLILKVKGLADKIKKIPSKKVTLD